MRTNIEIDDQLFAKAQKLSNIKTKKAVVEAALKLFVTMENQRKFSQLRGKIEMDDIAFQ
jgi:Arc/MetJ family transcription regulator